MKDARGAMLKVGDKVVYYKAVRGLLEGTITGINEDRNTCSIDKRGNFRNVNIVKIQYGDI